MGIYDFPRTEWREKSKMLRESVRMKRAMYRARHPDWKSKSNGFRDFVRRHKAYAKYEGMWKKNYKTKSMNMRAQIKSDKQKKMMTKVTRVMKTMNMKPSNFN